jgi:vitamin B12 transporter
MLSQTCFRRALKAPALVICISFFCLVNSTPAQQTASLSPVVVTATRTEALLTDILSDVTLVDREQIAKSGATSVSDVLSHLPGISISQTGGPASTTGVFIRGAESRFTAVFVDGIRIDSQSTGGAPWEVIPLAQIDRIEVLRGPAAAIYGSDAVAGVVQIFTRQGEPGFFPSVRLGMGSYNTTEVNTSLRGGEGQVDYALGLTQENSLGFNAQPSSTNPDKDGFKNNSFSARLGFKLDPTQKIDLSVLDNVVKAGYDAYGSVPATNDIARQHLQTLGLNWSSLWSDVWKTRLALTQGSDRYESSPSVYVTQTQVSTYLLHNELKLALGVLSADAERREDRLENAGTSSPNTLRSQNAVALGYGLKWGVHALQANARHDVDSQFGSKSTGALSYGYAFSPALRATASMATAFRAPTLYQLYSLYGVPSLLPETSNNHELGLRWLSGPDRASLVVYQNEVNNLINYVSGAGSCSNGVGPYAGCYGNTGHARMSGVTLTGGTVFGLVKLGGALDLMNPRNQDSGKYLARRAQQQSTLSAEFPVLGWVLGSEVQSVGERYDDSANKVRLAPYSLINLSAVKPINEEWRFLARINNVTNRNYQLANGYATPGFNFYLGLTWAPMR